MRFKIPLPKPRTGWWVLGFGLILAVGCQGKSSPTAASKKNPTATSDPIDSAVWLPANVFLDLTASRDSAAQTAIQKIRTQWKTDYLILLLDAYPFVSSRKTQLEIETLLESTTGLRFRGSDFPFYQWAWNRPMTDYPEYLEFKRDLMARVDPRFVEYFGDSNGAKIRLDEIRWGGVRRDGIPPLQSPPMIPAAEASWLDDSHQIFGVYLKGEARAYPRRILAWHEMFKDRIAGVEVNGVYCTLCGSMILYETQVAGTFYDLGTSGFLYRSNKLMYDQASKSLWSTLTGRPVFGQLAAQEIQLPQLPVVTTTWGEWRKLHPETSVLSLNTGFERDYGEGVAYRDYFADDELMFPVPEADSRLDNKTEVLGLRNAEADLALAISSEYLNQHPVLNEQLGDLPIVILTDRSGANRVYARGLNEFSSWDSERMEARDVSGRVWKVSEAQLVHPESEECLRLPAHRAFWFGWSAAFPATRLIPESKAN